MSALNGKYVAAVMFSHYPSDPRPRRAAEALAQSGMTVEVICLRQDDREPKEEVCNAVKVTRLSVKHRRGGKIAYLVQYGSFLLLSMSLLALRSCRRRYSLIHVHNMPDVLVFSALFPRLRGAKVLLDLHDPMPELMQSIYGLAADSRAVRLLERLERLSIRFAHAVLTVNQACVKLFTNRRSPAAKINVIMNSPDEQIFQFRPPAVHDSSCGLSKPFVIMYHGSIVERHGLDLAVTALQAVKKSLPLAELRIYGKSTPFLEEVLETVRKSELQGSVSYLGPKNLEEIAQAIGKCDLGIIPNRRSIFTEINTPTRIFEYLSQGKPVIAPAVPGIQDYFGPEDIVYFELGNADDLAAKIKFVQSHPNEVETIVRRGQEVYSQHKWSSERLKFLSVVNALLSSTKPSVAISGHEQETSSSTTTDKYSAASPSRPSV